MGDYDGDGFPDLYVTQYGNCILYTTTATVPLVTLPRKPALPPPDGLRVRCGSTMTTTDGWICLSATSSISIKPKISIASLITSPGIAFRRCTSRRPAGSSTTMDTAPSPMSANLQALRNTWEKRFTMTVSCCTTSAGKAGRSSPGISPPRGLAIGDFHNDGAVEVLVSVNDAAPLLMRNLAAKGNHWLGIRLVGKKSNRDAIGAIRAWCLAWARGPRSTGWK
jgi:hypothetical protein